jgi:hypothetical protein
MYPMEHSFMSNIIAQRQGRIRADARASRQAKPIVIPRGMLLAVVVLGSLVVALVISNSSLAASTGPGMVHTEIFEHPWWLGDSDEDGLTDGVELYFTRTDLHRSDTDGDHINDHDELVRYGTDPLQQDTDGDGLSDHDELFRFNSSPLLADTDGDGINDRLEVSVLPPPAGISTF